MDPVKIRFSGLRGTARSARWKSKALSHPSDEDLTANGSELTTLSKDEFTGPQRRAWSTVSPVASVKRVIGLVNGFIGALKE